MFMIQLVLPYLLIPLLISYYMVSMSFIGLIMLMITNLWVLILSIMAMTLSFRSPVSNNNYSIFFEV